MSANEVERMVSYQIGGFAAIAALQGKKVNHVKAHGALANLAAENKQVANAIARAVYAVDKHLILLAIAGTQLQYAGERAQLHTVAEGFADRAYDKQGLLVPRSIQGAVIKDAKIAAQRSVEMAQGKGLPCIEGGYIACQVESICVHGDTPGAVGITQMVREELISAGFKIQSFSSNA